jgi:hypothetical protein
MAELESEIYNKIIEVGRKAVSALKSNDLVKFEEYAEKGWELFPQPKENWDYGYNYSRMAFEGSFKNRKFELAKLWLNRMIENNNNLHFSDEECQFYIGKYLFEVGEYEKYLANFKAVVKSAGYRYFEDEDPKYLDFYKNPQKYMKQ